MLSYALDAEPNTTPEWATHTLLREELDHWVAHLSETNLSGAVTIQLRQHAQHAAAGLNSEGDALGRYGKVWEALLECIQVIDPSGLRQSAGYPRYGAGSQPSDKDDVEAVRHDAW